MEITHKNQGELDSTMLPFVMRELVELVMKKKALPLGDALYYIYSSKLYKSLLYETLEKEKTEEKRRYNGDTKILLFKMFCIENYREEKKQSAEETLLLFSDYGVFDFLDETFEMLHTQDPEYILDTITTYINKRK